MQTFNLANHFDSFITSNFFISKKIVNLLKLRIMLNHIPAPGSSQNIRYLLFSGFLLARRGGEPRGRGVPAGSLGVRPGGGGHPGGGHAVFAAAMGV